MNTTTKSTNPPKKIIGINYDQSKSKKKEESIEKIIQKSEADIKREKLSKYIIKYTKIINPPSLFKNVEIYHNYWEENNYKIIKKYPEVVNIHYIISHLAHTPSYGFMDYLINLISSKYIDETFFYLPQLISLLYFKSTQSELKDLSQSIETFLLDRCVNQIKYSVLITWIVTASHEDALMMLQSPEFSPENTASASIANLEMKKKMEMQSAFYEDLEGKVETTLVNGMRSTLADRISHNIKNKISQKEIYNLSLIKRLRVNYYNEIIDFYSSLKSLCEKLKEFPKEHPDKKQTRNYILRQELSQMNGRIKQFFEASFQETKDLDNDFQDLFRGIILPFDDTTKVDDNFNNIIVNIIPEHSMCFSTKARVPIKIVVESITVFECKKWSQLYLEESRSQMGELSVMDGEDQQKDGAFSPSPKESQLKGLGSFEKNTNSDEINKILTMVEYSNQHPGMKKDDILLDIFKEERRKTMLNEKTYGEKFNFSNEPLPSESNPFGEGWDKIKEKIKEKSSFKNFETYSIKSFIAKANDDLRQEVMTMQLIK
ncbi:MAG: hypothetical protein MJ252_28975, partial [archaeon]|nr:hypothetical protein [archaeon]